MHSAWGSRRCWRRSHDGSVSGDRRSGRACGVRPGPRDRGSVTAEFATVVPAVLLVLACCLGALQAVGQQVRLTDAAADAARSLSRGDSVDRATGLVHRAVPGAALTPERQGEFVCVRLSAPSSFGPFAAFGLTLQAGSCALGGGQ
ncbi:MULTISPECIES: TadE family protein [Cryobacterium]|uniref:Pilus assembly protein n=1 Tax=Cryobacterium breve TaxID=1259258 RepID=A0ABY2J7D4_9MICO|nr:MULTISPECIES: TadE family protein [Cryobacterium]TFC94547.1 pilus assembly protein [Cryobacterium sp. TmT3-12]TFD00865.1 pilus assembly protein [Cryobacterium breve]